MDSFEPFSHTLSLCINLLIKFVSPFLCHYSTPPPSFCCVNDDLFSQESSPFKHLHQFSSLPKGQIVLHFPQSLFSFLLKTSVCHTDIRALDKVSSPNNFNVSVAAFFNFKIDFMLTRCSLFIKHDRRKLNRL